MKKTILISLILLSSLFIFNCKKENSTLFIKNWPFNGSGKLVVYIYDDTYVKYNTPNKSVAKCISLSLSPPFKLISSDESKFWLGNGRFTIRIFISENSIKNIEMNDVIFTNGSAVIDFKSIIVNYRSEKEQEAIEKLIYSNEDTIPNDETTISDNLSENNVSVDKKDNEKFDLNNYHDDVREIMEQIIKLFEE